VILTKLNASAQPWSGGRLVKTKMAPRSGCFAIAAAERQGAGRFIVRADEKLTAFLELGLAIRACDETDNVIETHENGWFQRIVSFARLQISTPLRQSKQFQPSRIRRSQGIPHFLSDSMAS